MRVISLLLILPTLLLISGCSSTPKPKVVVKTQYVEKTVPPAKKVSPVNLHKMQFYVVTEDNYEEFSSKFIKKNGELVYVAISIKDYENLSLNMAELFRYIKQQKEVIVYYENATKPKEKPKESKVDDKK
jgi:hypothetical protein